MTLTRTARIALPDRADAERVSTVGPSPRRALAWVGEEDAEGDGGLDGPALSFARERERLLRQTEHSASVRRLRRALSIGLASWMGSTALDLYVTQLAGEGDLRVFIALQCVATLVVSLVLWRLRRQPEPSVRTLWLCDLVAFTSAAAVISLMSVSFRGIDSPFAAGIIVILLARGTTTHARWQHGALLFGAPALTYPVTMVIASRFDERIHAQLSDPRALSTFFTMLYFLAASWAMLTFGGHFAWRLRREAVGTRDIGRYKLERRLGSGGMADVWAAFDVSLQLRVALKTLSGGRLGSSALARFEREVRALAELSHPNTVRVLDYGVTDDGLWYYAMELLQGENLRELVTREGAVPVERAVRIVRQVLRALGEAHRKGIVHRDIKPENVFLARLGGEPDVVKLLDFGIAKTTLSHDLTLTNTGHLVGTPAYLAPELLQGRSADARSDIYSFGVMFYHLLTGRLPFPDETPSALFAAHMTRDPEPLCRDAVARPATPPPPAIPEAVERVVRRCMAKDPAERYGSTQEVLDDLSLESA